MSAAIDVILMLAITALGAALTGPFFRELSDDGDTDVAPAASPSVHDAEAGFAPDGLTQPGW